VELAMTPEERLQFIGETPRVGVLSVDAPGRGPVSAPVWFTLEHDGALTFSVGASSRKAVLLRAAGCGTMCVQSEEPPYRYVSVEGAAEELGPSSDASRRDRAARYLGPEFGALYFESTRDEVETTFALRPRRWASIDYNKLFGWPRSQPSSRLTVASVDSLVERTAEEIEILAALLGVSYAAGESDHARRRRSINNPPAPIQHIPKITGKTVPLPVNGKCWFGTGTVVVDVGTVLPWCDTVLDVACTVVGVLTVVGWPMLIEVVVSGMVTGVVAVVLVAGTVLDVVVVVAGTEVVVDAYVVVGYGAVVVVYRAVVDVDGYVVDG
jgi:hypothetical protein